MSERILDVEIGRRGIVRAAPDRKASQSAHSASFSPFPSAICSSAFFSPSVSSSSKGLRAVVSVDSQCKRIARRPLARTIRQSRNKIFMGNSNVAISNADYENRLSVASRRQETVRRCLASRKELRDSQKRQIAISRLLRKTMKNNARDSWNYIHRYDSVISTRTMDTEGGYVLAGDQSERTKGEKSWRRERENE